MDIWSNVWVKIALGLVSSGLLIALVFSVLALMDRATRNAASQHGMNAAQSDIPAESDTETEDPSVITEREHAGNTHMRPLVPSSTASPSRMVSTTRTASRAGSMRRLELDAGTPLIAERLELALVGGGIRSVRKTPGEPNDQVQLALPAEKMMEDYRSALGTTAALGGPPDDVTTKRILELIVPLQKVLLRAVPEPARRRMVTEGGGAATKLAAIELTLTDRQLERYPWELIADPVALCANPLPIAVWRSVLSPLDPPVQKRWTGNLLLTGRSAVPDELAWIKSELSGYGQIRVFDCPGIPPSFHQLLDEHSPAAFHLVAHAASVEREPTLEDLKISPKSFATDLGQSGVWVAVVNCCDSATAPSGGNRPPAYEIAERSGAATIGMAGLIQPCMSGLFATAFYRCLARGFSAVQAYHEAVCSVRDHDIYSTMWSIPVMYARTTNVIPFPADDQVRVRLGLEQVRFHVSALDGELQRLARRNFRSPGEWDRDTADSKVRTGCIKDYLRAATPTGRPATADERRRQGYISDVRDGLRSVLSATASSLARLSDPKVGAAERREVLDELPLHGDQYKSILRTLDDLIGQVY